MIPSKIKYIFYFFLFLFAASVHARTAYSCKSVSDSKVETLSKLHLEAPMVVEMPSTNFQTAFKFEERNFNLGLDMIYSLAISIEPELSKCNDWKVNLASLNFENLPKSKYLEILGDKYKYLGKEYVLTTGIYRDRKADNWRLNLTKQSYNKEEAKLSREDYLFKEPENLVKSELIFINPSDIESVAILKDADATLIYGSSEVNGAILITTKKGKEGNLKFYLNFNFDLIKWHQITNALKLNSSWSKSNSIFNPDKLKVGYLDCLSKLSANSDNILHKIGFNNYNRALTNHSTKVLPGLASKTALYFNRELIRRRSILNQFHAAKYTLEKNWYKKKRKSILCNNYIAIRERKFKSFRVKNAYLISPVQRT